MALLPTTPPAPWESRPGAGIEGLRDLVRFDAMAAAVWHLQRPTLEELIAARAVAPARVRAWCESGFQRDPLLAPACRGGSAVSAQGHPFVSRPHVLVCARPASAARGFWWWLLLARDGPDWERWEREAASLVLRRWAGRFDGAHEGPSGQVLTGQGQRRLLADATAATWDLRTGGLEPLLQKLHDVQRERFPLSPLHAPRECILEAAAQRWLVRGTRARAVPLTEAEHWHVAFEPASETSPPAVGATGEPRLAEALAHLHEHFHESPSLPTLARVAHVSPHHLQRLFDRHVGITPHQYRVRRQILEAQRLLTRTGLPVAEAGRAGGFRSTEHFARTFRNVVGMTPKAYRKQMQEGTEQQPREGA